MMSEVAMATPKTQEKTPAEENVVENKISDADLLNDLQDLAAEWQSLATELEISPMEQDRIKGEGSRVANCFQGVIREWLWGVKMEHTKKFLVETLRRQAVGENTLATKIDKDKEIPDSFDEDEKPTRAYKILVSKLADVAYKYPQLGIQLGVDSDKIKKIEHKVVNVRQYLEDMLLLWRKHGSGDLKDILEAIRSPTINNQRLASRLEKDWERYLRPESKKDVKGKNGTNDDVDADEEEVDLN